MEDIGLLFACVFVAGTASKLMGQDANWDFQNYHFYNPWAWLNGRLYTWDIAAAQLQSYHNPLTDIPLYLMVTADWRPRIISFVLAIPAGIAAFFLLKLVSLLFRELPVGERWLALLGSVTIGLTSAMGRALLGSTMNDWLGVAPIMAAIWLIVRALARAPQAALTTGALLGSGLLCGLATGAKLTFGVFAVAMCIALLTRGPMQATAIGRAIREASAFGTAAVVGTAITAGTWMWSLWRQFHNPIFPYGNGWFKSPWWYDREVVTRVYGPHTFLDWLKFPFRLASPPTGYVAEVSYTDLRLPTLYAIALFAAAAWLVERIVARGARESDLAPEVTSSAETWRFVGVFWITSFALSTQLYSTYRFIILLDLLCGVLILGLLRYLLLPRAVGPAVVLVTVVLVATTIPADWGRIRLTQHWLRVSVPPVEKNALVLLTTGTPMAYVLPFFPSDARHLGINNNISDPMAQTLLEDSIERVIREHHGPVYSLSFPGNSGTDALTTHGLSRVSDSCASVWTNMATSPIELCRLSKSSGK